MTTNASFNTSAILDADMISTTIDSIKETYGEPDKKNLYAYAVVIAKTTECLQYLDDKEQFEIFSPETGNWIIVSKQRMPKLIQNAVYVINKHTSDEHVKSVKSVKSEESEESEEPVRPQDISKIKQILECLKIEMSGKPVQRPKVGIIHVANGFLEPICQDGVWQWRCIPNEDGREFYFRTSFETEYHPEAQCPIWLAFLDSAGLQRDDQQFLQKYCGQIILGLGNRSQRILLADGASGTGKSTLGRILCNILGKENFAILHGDSLGSRSDLARYHDKRCILGMDVPRDVLLKKGGILKALTGGDYLQGALHGSDREVGFEGNLSVILISNDRLRLKLDGPNDVSAFRRRLASITFSPSKDANISSPTALIDKLKAEASGILNWMLEGALLVHEHGGAIDLTPEQKHRVEAILGEAKTGEAFVEECVEDGKQKECITVQELTDAYERFCIRKEWEPLSERNAFKEIKEAIFRKFPKQRLRHDITPKTKKTGKKTGKKTTQRGFKGLIIKQ